MKLRMARPARWVAMLSVVLLMVVTSATGVPAFKTTQYTTRTKQFTVAGSHYGGGTLKCPKGQRVVSGGAFWHIPGFLLTPSVATAHHLGASAPTGAGSGWYASGSNWSGSDAVLQIVIHCLPSSTVGPYTVRTTAFAPISEHGTTWTTAGGHVSCPSGQRIVTGGAVWQVPGDPRSPSLASTHHLSGSSPTTQADGWFGEGFAYHATLALLNVVALCAPTAKVGAYTVRQEVYEPNYSTAVRSVGSWLSCPTGKRVVASGAYWRRTGSTSEPDPALSLLLYLSGASPTTDKKGAYGSGSNGIGAKATLVIVVLCRPR